MKPGDLVLVRVGHVYESAFNTEVGIAGLRGVLNTVDLPAPEGLEALAAARPLLREALKGASTELALRATIMLAEIDAQLRMVALPRYRPTLIVVPK